MEMKKPELTNGRLFQSLFDNMQNGCAHVTCKYDQSNKLIDYFHDIANQAYINIVGIDPRQKWVSEIFPNLRKESPEVFEVFGRVSHRGKPETFETYNNQTNAWYKLNVFCLEEGTATIVFSDITDEKNKLLILADAKARIESAYEETINGFVGALRMRDHSTEEHSARVVNLTDKFARRLHLPEEEIAHLRRGAVLHDIGKIAVDDAILNKPSDLTNEERDDMKKHPVFAYEILKPLSNILGSGIEIPHYHHEHWNGKGYPEGRKGLEIPLAARLFTLVDIWDALTSKRPYREAFLPNYALQYIRDEKGGIFDPTLADEFISMMEGK